MGITSDDLFAVAEAAICADAYDIPLFNTSFVRPVPTRIEQHPELAFAFAAITGVQGSVSQLARQTLVADASDRPYLPTAISSVLRDFAPEQLSKVEQLHRLYPSARHQLRTDLRKAFHPNEADDFSRRCEGKCEGYVQYRKWRNAKAGAAEAVYEKVLADVSRSYDSYRIRSAIRETVSCDTCSWRMATTMRSAVARFLAFCGSC
jgi:hypothetical protein